MIDGTPLSARFDQRVLIVKDPSQIALRGLLLFDKSLGHGCCCCCYSEDINRATIANGSVASLAAVAAHATT